MSARAPAMHHLAVVARDLARSERFYRRLLGLRVLRRWTDERGRPRSVWLDVGHGVFLAVERAARTGGRRGGGAPGWHCVAFAIEPRARETWRRRLTRAGVAIERETPYSLFVRDPEANLVALSHYPIAR